MRLLFLAQYPLEVFPSFLQIAEEVSANGADVAFFTTSSPKNYREDSVVEICALPRPGRLARRIPLIQSLRILAFIGRQEPDYIVAQQVHALPAIVYKLATGVRTHTRVAGFFIDYTVAQRYDRLFRLLAGHLDLYIDICDLRVAWRRQEWRKLDAPTCVVRQAPRLQPTKAIEPHEGPPRVVFTASAFQILNYMNVERFKQFVSRLCGNGVALDWYLYGEGTDYSQNARLASLIDHPLYTVRVSVPKSALMSALRRFDAGLFWAPLADADKSSQVDRQVFLSAASNKIGEYIAAGLIVAHTSNPGLAYLPEALTIAFDPIDPIASADELSKRLFDREDVERRRRAAIAYHSSEMNFEVQVDSLIKALLEPQLDCVDSEAPSGARRSAEL